MLHYFWMLLERNKATIVAFRDRTYVQTFVRADTIATLFGSLLSGRQVTNLNGARIFRIVQQPDRAAVFPLQIPEAATHESAQHLLHRFAAVPLRLRDQNNKNSTPGCK